MNINRQIDIAVSIMLTSAFWLFAFAVYLFMN